MGVLVSPHGDLVVYVNGTQAERRMALRCGQVLRVATKLTDGNRKELHPRRKVGRLG